MKIVRLKLWCIGGMYAEAPLEYFVAGGGSQTRRTTYKLWIRETDGAKPSLPVAVSERSTAAQHGPTVLHRSQVEFPGSRCLLAGSSWVVDQLLSSYNMWSCLWMEVLRCTHPPMTGSCARTASQVAGQTAHAAVARCGQSLFSTGRRARILLLPTHAQASAWVPQHGWERGILAG